MSSSSIRLIVCGPPGCGRRTLLTALGEGVSGARLSPAASTIATELLLGPAGIDALLVIDSSDGCPPPVSAEIRLLARLGLSDVTLAINKVDLAVDPAADFAKIAGSCGRLADSAEVELTCIPVSALTGENVAHRGERTGFYKGPTLLEHLRERSEHKRRIEVPREADRYRVTIVWGADQPLLPGRAYTLATGELARPATITPLRFRLDLESGEHVAATTLGRDEVGICDIELAEPIAWPQGSRGRPGSFTLLDPLGGAQVGVGLVEHALRRSVNVRWQPLTIDRGKRAERLGQRPAVVWLTGISGAGKSTIANLVEAELHRRRNHTYLLDGDNIRHGLNSDLGFTAADRVENIRRVAEVARLMADAGLIVIVSFISPFRAERMMARSLLEPGDFVEVWVDTPLEIAEARDPKGLYRKARRGELVNFTGVDSPYEPPENAELRIDTTTVSPEEAAQEIVGTLERGGHLGRTARRDA